MNRPATRLLAALELLQNHRQLGGAELARRLRISRRTVRRYVAELGELGIPVTSEPGRGGGYMLVAGYKLPPMMFTDDEALAVSLGLLAADGLGLAPAAPAIESARSKFERVLPAAVKERARAIGRTVTIEPGGSAAAPSAAVLGRLSVAAGSGARVHLRYRSPAGEATERDFDTYGIAYLTGRWYAVGMCHLRGGVRSFRIDRIEAVRPAEGSFDRPTGFDALERLKSSVASIPRRFAAEVLLLTDLATASREVRPSLGTLDWSDEGVRLRSQVDSLEWLALELSRLPFAFDVRRPAELRDAVARNGHRLLGFAKPRRGRRPVARTNPR